MKISEVTHETFGKIICDPYYIYGDADFINLNKNQCESFHYLLFKEDKYYLGIIGGIKGGSFLSLPFAPFGGFIYAQKNIKISYLENAIDLLVNWAKSKNLKAIDLFLPPQIYDENFVSKQIVSLFQKKFFVLNIELNHFFLSKKYNNIYGNGIGVNGKNNLNDTLKNQFTFHRCENLLEKRIAYQVIKLHKQSSRQSLNMSWKEILMNTTIIDSDFFIAYNPDNFPVAAAIAFHVNQLIVQVVFWGENPKYSHLKPLNYLIPKIFEYYQEKFEIIDLGPASANYAPNHDVCNFKESIGCDTTLKFSFIRSLT
jgi:hypothetical protein